MKMEDWPNPELHKISKLLERHELCCWTQYGLLRAIARILGHEEALLDWWEEIDEAGGVDEWINRKNN